MLLKFRVKNLSSQYSQKYRLAVAQQHPQGSFIMSNNQQLQMSINLPPGLKQQQMAVNDGAMQIPKVEQMSSDSSSSSSSGEEEDGK